jgi:DNA-binding NarL/FixJ family response regulator
MTAGAGVPVDRVWEVLVVEDEADLRRLVRMVIDFDDRLEVTGAVGTGEEAVAMAIATRPDLVVLDHWLGGPLTGLDVAARVREACPRAQLILFTAGCEVDDLNDGGVDAVVLKSDISLLPEVAHRLLRHSA